MAISRSWFRQAAVMAALIPAFHAQAYFNWETVELPVSSGASCGNGTPYRFFINRTFLTSKTVVMFEGGGACWTQDACLGKGGILGASNPNGVPANYMTSTSSTAALGLVTPFTARLDPLTSVQTQGWNIVYVPYCTGDVHTGNKVGVYGDANPASPTTYYHRGIVNGTALANWLAANLSKPAKLLVTGFSAGGAGATANYDVLRRALRPTKSSLLADSGPLFQAPAGGDISQYPSIPLHTTVRTVWGWNGPNGAVSRLASSLPAGSFDANNVGSLPQALATAYPSDRMGYALFKQDLIYSAFSYASFDPSISGAPTEALRNAALLTLWNKDIGPWINAMNTKPNIGYYVPYGRDFLSSHTLTTLTFDATAVANANQKNIGSFVDNLLDGSGTPTRAVDTGTKMQSSLTLSVLNWVLDTLAPLLGISL